MTNLKEYLRQACILEQDIYEKTNLIKRTEGELLELEIELEKNITKKKQKKNA